MLSQQIVNPGAILEEFWFSAHAAHSAEGAEWMSWLTCLKTVCLWVSYNLTGVHKFCSLFVHKIQCRSLMRFVCEGLFRWGENGLTLAGMWQQWAFLWCSCPSPGRARHRCLMGWPDHAAAALEILLNDTSFATYPFSNIDIFKNYSQWTVYTWMWLVV